MADRSVVARDEFHESEASEAWMFCFENTSAEKSSFAVDLLCFISLSLRVAVSFGVFIVTITIFTLIIVSRYYLYYVNTSPQIPFRFRGKETNYLCCWTHIDVKNVLHGLILNVVYKYRK